MAYLAKLLSGAIATCLILTAGVSAEETGRPDLLIVTGAGGTPEYEELFRTWTDRWREYGESLPTAIRVIGLETEQATDREQVELELRQIATDSRDDPLIVVLIGHGTDREGTAKFNLRGPDITASELAHWLDPITRPVIVIHCASSSGAFLKPLASENRITITATKSGDEENFARFGDFFSQALTDPAADLDHDETISLLEVYLLASDRVAKFYQQQNRLATEHSLLDDNGDGLGTPADFFRGIHAVKAARSGASLDGLRAHQVILTSIGDPPSLTAEQLAERDSIERQIQQLRAKKSSLSTETYYAQLEPLLIELARLGTAAQ